MMYVIFIAQAYAQLLIKEMGIFILIGEFHHYFSTVFFV